MGLPAVSGARAVPPTAEEAAVLQTGSNAVAALSLYAGSCTCACAWRAELLPAEAACLLLVLLLLFRDSATPAV